MIHPERLQALNDKPARDGAYVLYWMQQSQRASGNPALEVAIHEASARRLPVVVGFGLMDDYPEANARHYTFLLQGLRDVAAGLGDAAMLVCDRGYLRHQRGWRETVAANAPCAVLQVEGDVVVPVETASTKAEYAARTIRPKILRQRDRFLSTSAEGEATHPSLNLGLASDIDVSDVDRAVGSLTIDGSVRPVTRLAGGTVEARARLVAAERDAGAAAT